MVARAERARRAYTPDEIRDRLHARITESAATPSAGGSSASARTTSYRRARPDASA